MRKFVFIFCLLIFALQLLQIIYFERHFFTSRYDTQYWKDRYEHSQYQLPLSKRIIGDDGLFAYSGYRLIKGDNPFSINNDKPPVAKYLFGLSILLFNNPLYIVFFFGFSTLVVFYFIARYLLKNNTLAFSVTTLIFLDPLFFSQFWITGLDLIQLFFLLLNLLLMIYIRKLHGWSIFLILGSGLSLGLFAEVKPPIVLPAIFMLETIFFFSRGLKEEYIFFVMGILLGIFIPYLRFIYLGNGLIDVLRVHNFMASIYLQSGLKTHVGAIWLTLLGGRFPNVSTGSLTTVYEWWMMWPMLTLTGIGMALFSVFTKKTLILIKGIAVFILVSFIIFTFIPSYPRYLVIVLPFMYLFGILAIKKIFNKEKIKVFSAILLIYGIVNSFFFMYPKPEAPLNGFFYNLSHLFFHDIYQENIVGKNTLGLTRDQFRYITNKAIGNAGVKEIEVKELARNIPLFASRGNVKIRLTYKTQDLGKFEEEKKINLLKVNNQWKIRWDWNIILNDFKPDYVIESDINLGKRGSIVVNNGAYRVKDESSFLVSVNPEKIDLTKEQLMLELFSSYGYKGDANFQNAYLENVLPDTYVPIMTLSKFITQEEKENLLSFSGVKLSPHYSRIFLGVDAKSIDNSFYNECCTRIYSSYNYHGVKGIEKKFDKELWGYSGGKILMKDKNGGIVKVIFEKAKKDGQDIVLK